MKIKNKIIIFFSIIIGIIVVLFGILSYSLKENYMDNKYNKAYNYYYENDISIDEYSEYLINHGFIVTTDEVQKYVSSSDATCHLDSKEIVIYEGSDAVLYAIINQKISNDFLRFVNVILVLIMTLVIILLSVIYLFVQKVIIKRIKILENRMNIFENDRLIINNQDEYHDEITDLFNKFNKMAHSINVQDKERQELIVALSHELKNPISKIEATLNMYKENVPSYSDKEKTITSIIKETDYMTDNINKLLMIYKGEYTKEKLTKIDLKKYLQRLFNNKMLLSRNINVNIIGNINEFETNVDKLDIIINNIITNIYKYARESSIVNININNNQIIISNEINNDLGIKSTKLGNAINDFIIKDLNYQYTKEVVEGKYITTIVFSKKDN